MNGTELHAASVGVTSWILSGMSKCLDKAEAYAAEKKFETDVYFSSRLAPDMLPLTGQIHLASAYPKNLVHRLAGTEPPDFAPLEPGLAAARARIAQVQSILAATTPASLEGGWTRPVTVQMGPERKITLPGGDYLQRFVLPNFYFHVTMAYAILRHNGVPLGKVDYMSPPPAA